MLNPNTANTDANFYSRQVASSRADMILEALALRIKNNEPLPSKLTIDGVEIETPVFLEGLRTDRREAWPTLVQAIETAASVPLVSEVAITIKGRAIYSM